MTFLLRSILYNEIESREVLEEGNAQQKKSNAFKGEKYGRDFK